MYQGFGCLYTFMEPCWKSVLANEGAQEGKSRLELTEIQPENDKEDSSTEKAVELANEQECVLAAL